MYGYWHVDNVRRTKKKEWSINSVKFSECWDFETLLRKSCGLHSETKTRVICDGEKFSLGRMASFSVKIVFNRRIVRRTQFYSRGGCCVCLTSAYCTYFWNKNSFSRSCAWKVQASEASCNWGIYGTRLNTWHKWSKNGTNEKEDELLFACKHVCIPVFNRPLKMDYLFFDTHCMFATQYFHGGGGGGISRIRIRTCRIRIGNNTGKFW